MRIACKDIAHEQGFMVGDRLTDVEAGRQNGLYVIGCAFGFAQAEEFAGADRIVKKFSEILTMSGM
ncbi:HAD family hydrolase [Sulfoacidibacillus thermotolerans]|uniref:HAD family hydrolase n=1 Tax=Sulfoacidibacillus thermotolerans TaxID=1765684 RepID=UPI00248266A1|nr:HAD hydrolase-like protein [Sulfoacidibacillus thermotolerans]